MKDEILKDIYDYILDHQNFVTVPEMQEYIQELSEKYRISVRTIYRYIHDTDWIHRTGFPLKHAVYFVMNNEMIQPFKRYGVDVIRYINAILNESNRKALIDTVDAMIRYDYEPTGNHGNDRDAIVMLLLAFGYERSDESDRQLYKYVLLTYRLFTEFVNPFEYLLNDFFDEPIDIEYELKLIRGDDVENF